MREDEVAAVDEIDQDREHRRAPEPGASEGAAPVLRRRGEEQAERRDPGATVELQVRRAPDERVLPEGVVPPGVHRRGREDHEDPEGREGEAERQAERPPPVDGATEFVGVTEGRAGDARQGAGPDAEPTAVDEDVRQDEERVAADGAVPRRVEIDTDHSRGARNDRERQRDVRDAPRVTGRLRVRDTPHGDVCYDV